MLASHVWFTIYINIQSNLSKDQVKFSLCREVGVIFVVFLWIGIQKKGHGPFESLR